MYIGIASCVVCLYNIVVLYICKIIVLWYLYYSACN